MRNSSVPNPGASGLSGLVTRPAKLYELLATFTCQASQKKNKMKKNQTDPMPVGRVTPRAPQTSPTNDGVRGATRPTPDRRRFLKLAGATLLAGAALPQAAQAGHTGGANISDGTSIIYFG